MTFEPRPKHGDRGGVFLQVGEQGLLGGAAGVAQRDSLAGVEALHPLGQGRGHGIRQRQVHVVAAEQDVLADGQPRQGQVAPLVGDGDQGEVGRAAADVADQDDVADLDLLAPLLVLDGQPGVKGGLGLFEERDVLQARLAGRLHGELAGDGVERRRDGQEDLLVLEPVGGRLAGDPGVPGVAQVLEIRRRRGDRRDLASHRRRPSRGGSAARRSTPACESQLLAELTSRPGTLAPCSREDAHHAVRRRLPRQVKRPRREFLGAGQVEERREERPLGDVVDRDDLRNRQARDRAGLVVSHGVAIGIRQRRVRRPQVDANHVARHAVCLCPSRFRVRCVISRCWHGTLP